MLPTFAQLDARLFYEFAPILPLTTAWQWLLLCAATGGLVTLIVWIYRRDGARLPKPISASLLFLRLLVVAGILLFVFNPEKRSESRLVQASRLAILVDTSLSMGLADRTDASSEPTTGDPQARRIDLVAQLFGDTELLNRLNAQHDLQVYRFGNSSQLELVGEFPRSNTENNVEADDPTHDRSSYPVHDAPAWASRIGNVAVGILILGLLAMVFWQKRGPVKASKNINSMKGPFRPLPVLVAIAAFAVGLILLALCDLADSRSSLFASLGWRERPTELIGNDFDSTESKTSDISSESPIELFGFDWSTALLPQGTSTRIGTAIQEVVGKGRGTSLAGVLLISDGGQNDGLPINRALAEADEANIPVYAIGIGDNRAFTNVRISELNAPQRVIPGDRFNVVTILQAFGMEGRTVQVQLFAIDASENDTSANLSSQDMKNASLIDEQSVTLPDDGQPVSLTFELENQQAGQTRYVAKIVKPEHDLDASDNSRSTMVQSIDRKTKVLLMAGGPGRDYQFLRNQLFRDDSVVLNVLLQTAKPGADQESDELLFDFPETKELAEFDCIVAFDPDWQKLNAQQAKGLDDWVSTKAGGLVVIAGPVFTPEWTRAARGVETIDRIRDLYPVSFFSQGSARLKLGRFGGEQPFPLKFSRAGRNARHLWLGKSASENINRWDEFAGVFGFYAVNEAKPGADVLAWFSDESTAIEGQLPIYLASQFYGSGRVLFQASSEIWRLRSVDVDYFQNYYLNLIRWVSQGRLLRDSNRGVLLLDRDRCWVGDQLVVRAILRDESDQPMMQRQVIATLQRPGGMSESLPLVNVNDPARPGTFTSTFVTVAEGDYQVALPLPGGDGQSILRSTVQATIPDLEKAKPERNDSLMQQIAAQTGGQYFHTVSATGEAKRAIDGESEKQDSTVEPATIDLIGESGLPKLIRPVDQETFLPGLPDAQFAQKLARWLLILLVTFLCGEWILRRLNKLA